jgi:[acyl-carrier-protein] S-malonyltransferase
MAAVLGLSPEQVESLLAEWTAAGLEGLYAANFNAPKQVVVAGTAAALAEAETRFKEAGARRVVRLSVAGPFHSPLVREAAQEFAPVLESISFSDPKFPLFSNVTGARVSSGAEAKALALRHMTEPVRWTTEEAALGAMAPTALLELGPGKVLQGLWKDSGSAVPCYSAGTIVDMDAALARILAVDKE